MKRLITSMLIVLLLCVAFIGSFYKGYYSFATNQDGTLTNDELDVAMLSWLQSHGGNIFSPQNYRARKTYEAGLLHNFVYGAAGGYDAIRQHINGGVGGNNELRFDYDGFIIHQLNTWLNTELQNGSFGQGVSLNENGIFSDGTDNTVYSGKIYIDDDNYYALVYITQTKTTNGFYPVISKGSIYRYTNQQQINLGNNANIICNFNGASNTVFVQYSSNIWRTYYTGNYRNISDYKSNVAYDGGLVIAQKNGDSSYYLGSYLSSDNNIKWLTSIPLPTADNGSGNVNVVFYTNLNNNITDYPDINADGTLYITPKVKINGEYKPYTVNEGDTIQNVINNYYNDSNEKDKTISVPSDSPNGGSGGSGGSGGTPPNWNNPYPNLSPDGNGGFNFNFTFPDLNIDWNINGLSEKFPFSIPFDLIRFVSILNAEPETPHFEGTVNLIVYEWNIDADLSDFDNLAGIVRNVEFIGFCITLILITRRMIKG